MTFSSLKELRKSKGKRQEDLEAACGGAVRQHQFSLFEKGMSAGKHIGNACEAYRRCLGIELSAEQFVALQRGQPVEIEDATVAAVA